MNRPVRLSVLLLLPAVLAVSAGCFVTSTQLNAKLNDFDEYLKKREARGQVEGEARLETLNKTVEAFRTTLQTMEASLKSMKADLTDMQDKMGLALESAKRMQELQERVQRGLDEVYAVEGRLKRDFKNMDSRLGTTLEKYREVLLEEKRILMERLRTINETMRNLSSEKKEEGED